MILSELRAYMMLNRRVTLSDLVTHFNVEADALRGMLAKWVGKGKVRLLSKDGGSACGTSCCKCNPLLTEMYEWLDDSR